MIRIPSKWAIIACVSILIGSTTGCLVFDNKYTAIPPGPWRGILKLEFNPVTSNPRGEPLPEKVGLEFEEITEGQLPFNFEVTYVNEDSLFITIQNGEENIVVDDIIWGRDRVTGDDTIRINFPVFDSYIRGKYMGNVIEGEWVVTNRENYRIPFVAYFGKDHRFTELTKAPAADLTGRWATTFGIEGDDPYPAIAEFEQSGNYLTGTFLTETGDYRYLEGTVQGDKVYLSTFDGSHAFLFEAKINSDGSLIGSFRSGSHYRTLWEAERNSEATLRDPDELTYLKEGYDQFQVAFPNSDGEIVDLSEPPYAGKPVLVQILGTWCPNCRDETKFLVDYLADNPDQDVEVVGLAFERHEDPKKAFAAIETMRDKMNVPYPVLLAGPSSKEGAGEALPMLNAVISYPTLLFLDAGHRVQRIHTGFAGPATSEFESFKQTFAESMERLTAPAQ
jgi:thiol-disulfide isomerase/thioredoxin